MFISTGNQMLITRENRMCTFPCNTKINKKHKLPNDPQFKSYQLTDFYRKKIKHISVKNHFMAFCGSLVTNCQFHSENRLLTQDQYLKKWRNINMILARCATQTAKRIYPFPYAPRDYTFLSKTEVPRDVALKKTVATGYKRKSHASGAWPRPNSIFFILGVPRKGNLLHKPLFINLQTISIKCYHFVICEIKLDCVIVIYKLLVYTQSLMCFR